MNYTHEQVCKEYEKTARRVSDTMAHQQIRIVYGTDTVTLPTKRGNGNIRAFLKWFLLPSIFSVIVAYFLAGAM